MSANTAAGAVSRFLSTPTETLSSGAMIEQLARLLDQYGDEGLRMLEAADLAGFSTVDFLTALSTGQTSRLIEVFEGKNGTRIRLTEVGKSFVSRPGFPAQTLPIAVAAT